MKNKEKNIRIVPNGCPKWAFFASFWVIFYRFYAFMQQKTALLWIKMRFWWAEVDSNHRSRRRQIYSLIHLAALESAHIFSFVEEPVIGLEPTTCWLQISCSAIELHRHVYHFGGALGRNRTTDRQIFSLLLYQLSYQGILATQNGLEPSTSSVTGWRSNQLNYWATSALIKYRGFAVLSIGFFDIF